MLISLSQDNPPMSSVDVEERNLKKVTFQKLESGEFLLRLIN